ncbi:MAG: DEAD/DEAH box helicase [Actinomycetales bacterium]|nr:DEAD/DEAH box helicase [Actinomycetales bacterium]
MADEVALSPAERFAAARARRGTPELDAFRDRHEFPLDPFQEAACRALEEGHGVLVAAPTGAGKTIVAEFAVHLALTRSRDKVFYTTPMKALSNQKFSELAAEHGPENVGLLTGDTNINSGARVVVMTTEVLRNMLYADSPLLRDLRFVIMDEVHYLADRFRGAVWEEVIIHLPASVALVSLSATVSNAEEFGDWLQAVRGSTTVIVSEERPVPLQQHVLVRGRLLELFDDEARADGARASADRVNPELVRLAAAGGRGAGTYRGAHPGRHHRKGQGGRGSEGGQRWDRGAGERLDRPDVVRLLDGRGLLPAIFFIFSRAGCDQAVEQVVRRDVRLTERWERDEIRALVEERTRTLPDADLGVLGYWNWLDGLQRGVAAHHAGMLPAFKEIVEELFQRKLLKAVFATETLALGVNMPARTVVLEKLEKFNGEARVPITPGEYTQLTGRAGRRGIDVEGHAVIQWAGGLDPQAVAALASRRTYPLNSSFRPTYNMAVNLVEQFGRPRTREILESSFAQFQADRAVVDLAREVRKQEEALAAYAEAMRCHLGDFTEYASVRRELTDLEKQVQRAERSGSGESRATRERRQRRITELRKRMRAHPCHSCNDREAHARWAERWWRLKRDHDRLTGQIHGRTGAVAAVFDRITELLRDLRYLEHDAHGALVVAAPGRALRRIYGERDLLVAECLRRGLWDGLDAPQLAAMISCLVYEPRREQGDDLDRRLPRGGFAAALEATEGVWEELSALEGHHRLPVSEPLSAAIALATAKWAQGQQLDSVLRDAGLAAGDFVRVMKQAIDLLDQVSLVADGEAGRTARSAIDGIRRGIVAYSAVA